MRMRLAFLMTVALAGCVGAEAPVPPVLPGEDACGAAGMQGLLGQDRAVLAAMTLPAGTRVIEPGMAITEDFRPDRLNLDLDSQGRIVRVWCG